MAHSIFSQLESRVIASQWWSWQTLGRSKLARYIGFWVLMSIVLIEALIVIPSYFVRRQELLEQLAQLGRLHIVKIEQLIGEDASAQEFLEITRQLTMNTVVIGASLYHADGSHIGDIGEVPMLTPQAAQARQLYEGENIRYDVHWSAASLGGDLTVITRLNAVAARQELQAYTWRMLFFILLITLVVTIAAMLAVSKTMLTPVLHLRQALLAVGENVTGANTLRPEATLEPYLQRSDELGEVIRSFVTMAARIRGHNHALQTKNSQLQEEIAERQRVAQVLLRLQKAFESSSEAIAIAIPTASGWQLRYDNPAFRQLFGYELEELNRLGGTRALHQHPEQEQATMQQLFSQGAWQGEVSLRSRDGRAFPCYVRLDVIYDKDNAEPVGIVGLHTDISERKHVEAELHDYRHHLEQLVEERTAALSRAQAELDVAQHIQRFLLPDEASLRSIDTLDIAAYMASADEVGGDYYDVLPHAQGVKIAMGDVTGHGLDSGLVMLMTQTAVRALLYSNLSSEHFLSHLNRTLYANMQRMRVDKSLTFVMLDYAYDSVTARGKVQVSGQHESLLHVNREGKVKAIDTIDLGFPLGLSEDIGAWIQAYALDLASGEGLVLYTDGITEAESSSGELYGLSRLCEVIAAHWQHDAETIKARSIADVYSFIGEQSLWDDITLLVLKQR